MLALCCSICSACMGSQVMILPLVFGRFAVLQPSGPPSLGFHAQSNGQAKSMNQEMMIALRSLASRNPASWSKHLLWLEYAHNTAHFGHWSHPLWMLPGLPNTILPKQESQASIPKSRPSFGGNITFGSTLLRPSYSHLQSVKRCCIPAPCYMFTT